MDIAFKIGDEKWADFHEAMDAANIVSIPDTKAAVIDDTYLTSWVIQQAKNAVNNIVNQHYQSMQQTSLDLTSLSRAQRKQVIDLINSFKA